MRLEGAGGCRKTERRAHKQASERRAGGGGAGAHGRSTSTSTPTTFRDTREPTCSAVPLAKEPGNYITLTFDTHTNIPYIFTNILSSKDLVKKDILQLLPLDKVFLR